jgi:dolichol-phosphate mannosyltransferase
VKTTFIIPTFNEAENIPKLFSAIFSLPLPGLSILVVDDNSPDGTGKLVESFIPQYEGRLEVLHRPGKMGLGTAYITGFKHAMERGAQAVGQMDADFSHPIARMCDLVETIQNCDCDVAIGSRYVQGGSLDENWPLWRKGLSAWGNFYARTILGLPLRDCTGGFRLWRSEALSRLPLDRVRSNGYVFQVETAYMGHRMGCSFKEIPIHFADRRWGKSKMNFRIQVEAAVRVWQLLPHYRDLR